MKTAKQKPVPLGRKLVHALTQCVLKAWLEHLCQHPAEFKQQRSCRFDLGHGSFQRH
jgi:hypothetical protein